MKKKIKISVKTLAIILVAILLTLYVNAGVSTPSKTQNLNLELTDPLIAEKVNANFVAVDEEFAARAVTPDMYKQAGDPDDTAAVQAAFDSGKPIIFTRNYGVKSVTISGNNQMINFNGFWLAGNVSESDSESDKESVLKITGSYLTLYNIFIMGTGVNMDDDHSWWTLPINTNYKSALKWYSNDPSNPSSNNNIQNLLMFRFKAGLVYGANIEEESPVEYDMRGNTIFGIHTRSVQKPLISNQPGGSLHVIGGVLDCNIYEWMLHANLLPENERENFVNDFYENSYTFYNKHTNLTLDNLELLKTQTDLGVGFRGYNFNISNTCIEIGGVWGYIEGDASLDQIDGGYQGGNPIGNPKSVFEISPEAKGRLIVQKFLTHRHLGANIATLSSATIIGGLNSSPAFSVLLENCKFVEWSGAKVAKPEARAKVKVKNCYFVDADNHSVVNDSGGSSSAGIAKQNLLIGIDTTGENMATRMDMSKKSEWYKMWANSADGYFRKNVTDKPTGFKTAVEYTMNIGMGYVASPMFEVLANTELVFSAWVKCSKNAGANTYLDVLYYKEKVLEDSNYIGQQVVTKRTEFTEGEWKKVSITFSVPTTAKAAIIRLLADTGSVYVTGLELSYSHSENNPEFNNSFINTLNQALDEPGRGVIFTAPDGKRYIMTVGDDGVLQTQLLQ